MLFLDCEIFYQTIPVTIFIFHLFLAMANQINQTYCRSGTGSSGAIFIVVVLLFILMAHFSFDKLFFFLVFSFAFNLFPLTTPVAVVCLNEKIQFGLVLQQIIRTDHLHLGVIELNKHGCEECRPKLLWDFQLFKMGRSKVSSCRLKDKFEKMRSLWKPENGVWEVVPRTRESNKTVPQVVMERTNAYRVGVKVDASVLENHLISEKVCFDNNPRDLP